MHRNARDAVVADEAGKAVWEGRPARRGGRQGGGGGPGWGGGLGLVTGLVWWLACSGRGPGGGLARW